MSGFLRELRGFARYGAVGAATTVGFYLIYLLLLRWGFSAVAAAGVCYAPAVTVSYLANRRWAFESAGTHRSDMPKYLAAYLLGFFSTLLTVSIAVKFVRAELAQLINIGVTPIVIYSALRLFRFGQAAEVAGPRK